MVVGRAAEDRRSRRIRLRGLLRLFPMDASVTNSNRRVRTRTHGGVAGVGG